MRNFIIILLSVFLMACENDEDKAATWMDAGTIIYVKDKDGNDLLNPENENAYDFNEMEVYFLIDGEEVSYYNSNMDAPKGIYLLVPEGDEDFYRLSVPYDPNSKSKHCVSILKWNDTEQDIFKAEMKYIGYNVQARKVWINDKLVWDIEDEEYKPRVFTLIK